MTSGESLLSEALLKAAEHCSVTSGHLTCVDQLLAAGASLHSLPDGSSFLSKACLLGQIQLVELALDRGGRVRDADSSGKTPLHLAVDTDRGDNGDVVELLLARGADPNACDREGRTPLHYAGSRGAHLSLKVLLEHRALVGLQDDSRQTALDLAIANGHSKCVECIRARPISSSLDEDKPLHTSRPRSEEQRLLMSPGLDIGEELETKSGSSLSSNKHAVVEEGVAGCEGWEELLTRTKREAQNRRRELLEEQRAAQLASEEAALLLWEKEWLMKQAQREQIESEKEIARLEELCVVSSPVFAPAFPSILSFKRQPLSFNDLQTLSELQADLDLLVGEVDQWQVQQSTSISRAVDQWRSFTARVFPGAQTKVYGSVATQLFLPGFTVDLVVIHSPLGSGKTLRVLEDRCRQEFWVELAVLDASQYLPVLHVTTLIENYPVLLRITGMDGRHRGLKSTQVVKTLLETHPTLRAIYLALKHLFSYSCASDPRRGGISSYALFLLAAAQMRLEECATAAEGFLRFLSYYAFECAFIAPISALSSPPAFDPPYQCLHVQDPISPQSNLASTSDMLFFINFLRVAYSSLVHSAVCSCESSRHLFLKTLAEARLWVTG